MLFLAHMAVPAEFHPAPRHDGLYRSGEFRYPETMAAGAEGRPMVERMHAKPFDLLEKTGGLEMPPSRDAGGRNILRDGEGPRWRRFRSNCCSGWRGNASHPAHQKFLRSSSPP